VARLRTETECKCRAAKSVEERARQLSMLNEESERLSAELKRMQDRLQAVEQHKK